MTITRVGTNAKYADGWDAAFGRGRGGNKTAKKSAKKAAARKKPSAKKAGRKSR